MPRVTPTPVPDRAAEPEPAALPTSSDAVLAPRATGANAARTVQVVVGARLRPAQPSSTIVNWLALGPLSEAAPRAPVGAPPVLVTVNST